MKFNKWTLGLAAVGAVSMASAVRADEAPKMSQLNTALSNTTISGYVSTSMNWQWDPKATAAATSPGSSVNPGSSPASAIPLQSGKANGFNLDVVKVTIAKPEDATPWASGYQVDLLFGPDAVGWNPVASSNGSGGYYDGYSDFAIQQAFITLNTPVGNGIDWKFGVWNTVVGYESFDNNANPNYTRSWGWAVEPTEHTGVLAAYKVNDEISFNAGVANTLSTGINTRNTYNNSSGSAWHKTVMGSLTFNAPSNWGWASGSAFYVGAVYGFAGGTQGNGGTQGGNQANVYAGATLNSPWKNVTFGAAFDYVQNLAGTSVDTAFGPVHADDYIFGLYNTIKATDKLSFNTRGEYWEIDAKQNGSIGSDAGMAITETVEYDLWANVMSRLEFRYDKVITSDYVNAVGGYVLPTGVVVTDATSYGVYANLVYKF
jgi:Putative beta-barrel porin-2, OmpL-like. bbp2